MNKVLIKIFFLSVLLFTIVNAKQTFLTLNQNEVYFLPKQSEIVKSQIMGLISNAKESITISMYNFSYKKFAKELVSASKKGIKVKVYLDKSKVKKDDQIYKYLKKNGIVVIVPKKKLHTKIAIFDNKNFMIGSSNWTKKSFKENHEIILFTKDKKLIKKVEEFIDSL